MADARTFVFISYSHDSDAHKARVRALADRLRADGVDVELDQYQQAPAEGWPRWTRRMAHDARFVLVVCTETYRRRYEGDVPPTEGRGVQWEGAVLTQQLYNAAARNERFVPVIFAPDDGDHIPLELQATTHYAVTTEAGYRQLLRRLTDQPAVVKPPLGARKELPPEPASPSVEAGSPSNVEPPGSPPGRPDQALSEYLPRILKGLAVVALPLVLVIAWPRSDTPPEPQADPVTCAVYRLRVTVLDPDGTPVTDGELASSVGGEQSVGAGYRDVVLPGDAVVPGQTVDLYARRIDRAQRGETSITLTDACQPTATIRLQTATAAVAGVVRGIDGRPLSGVRVYRAAEPDTAVLTGADGSFRLSREAPEGQQIHLWAEKEGFETWNRWLPVGEGLDLRLVETAP